MRTVTSRDVSRKDAVGQVLAEGGTKRIVIVIPGIRTNADWVDAAASQMQLMSADSVCFVKSAGERISTFQLVTRFGLSNTRNAIRDDITNLIIRKLTDGENVSISLLCHSLGTDIAADIVKTIDYKFEHIVLLGAVCSKDNVIVLSRSCVYLTNIRGTMDQYPLIASIVRPDRYGTTGTFGTSNPNVGQVRWEYDHASCTNWESIKNVVIPLVEMGTKIDSVCKRSFSFTHYTYSKYIFRLSAAFGTMSAIYGAIYGGFMALICILLTITACIISVAQYFFPDFTRKILKSIITIYENENETVKPTSYTLTPQKNQVADMSDPSATG